jgi:hypothetical protein
MAPRLAAVLALVFLLPGAAPADEADSADAAVLALFSGPRPFQKAEYKAVRAAFAKRFELRHAREIKRAFGGDYDTLTAWLNEHPDVKEELYTAIDEQDDKIEAALGLVKAIWNRYPDKVAPYANLVIAVALAWDDPDRGIYDYGQHQRRTKSTLPGGHLGALDNFQHLVGHDKLIQGRSSFLPWEFLVHVVNHKTPAVEREWALKNYTARLPQFGKCYKDVPYDQGMLAREEAKLEGHPYTLENLRRFGGVCAMQADFAARVGKSLGLPAEYVSGQSNSGFLHAWVMWVDLRGATRDKINFSLESYGRYNLDQYYVGTLHDPHTGRVITDRDLELRLSSVGFDTTAKRQADLLMRAYPLVREKQEMTVNAQLAFLDKVIALCPYNEAAWLTLARLSKEGKLKKEHLPTVMAHADKLFSKFAPFPDFTWKVINDLLTVQDDLSQRQKLYERLVAAYEGADRADLACEARLKLADIQADAKRWKEAANGVAFTIQKFPGEGRYVPQLMDRLLPLCQNFKGGSDLLQKFYLATLPKIPPKRNDLVSPHCVAMYEKGIAFFREQGKDDIAKALERDLRRIKASGKELPK